MSGHHLLCRWVTAVEFYFSRPCSLHSHIALPLLEAGQSRRIMPEVCSLQGAEEEKLIQSFSLSWRAQVTSEFKRLQERSQYSTHMKSHRRLTINPWSMQIFSGGMILVTEHKGVHSPFSSMGEKKKLDRSYKKTQCPRKEIMEEKRLLITSL